MTHPSILAFVSLLLFPSVAFAQDKSDDDPNLTHARLYKKVAPAVVFVRAGSRSGSGFFIDKSGIVITTSTSVSTRGKTATIQTPDHKRLEAEVLGRDADLELAVLRVKGSGYAALSFGDSDKARIGQMVYTLGDSFGSMQTDDQVAISMGVISGKYELTKKKKRGTYIGQVLETSAAVNQNQDGGPLVDARGRVLGMITLNYDESKFTGVAIPINKLKAAIRRILRDSGTEVAKEKKGKGWFGLRHKEVDNGLEVILVTKGGPADKAGIKVGDIITQVDKKKVLSSSRYRDAERGAAVGSKVKIRLLRDGEKIEKTLKVGKKRVY